MVLTQNAFYELVRILLAESASDLRVTGKGKAVVQAELLAEISRIHMEERHQNGGDMRLKLGSMAMGALAALSMTGAHAGLIGDTVGCAQTGGGQFVCSPSTATVTSGGAPEFGLGFPSAFESLFSIDVDATSITLTRTGVFDSLLEDEVTLSSLNLGSPITGISVTDSGLFGVAYSVHFTADSVVLDMNGANQFGATRFNPGGYIKVDLLTNSVPAPGTLTLLGLGLAGLAATRRRKP